MQPIGTGDQFIYSTEDGTIHARTGGGEETFGGLNPWAPELAAADGKLLGWSFLGQRLYTFGTSDGPVGPADEAEPVVFVPGLATSFNSGVLINPPGPDFSPRDGWRFVPGAGLAYEGLFMGLRGAGLVENEDFFIAHYDWRLPAADAAERYLEEVIDEAKRISGRERVDIVAHSYGGLVARSYIQGGRYLNDVDQLIMIGTPNKGAANAYAVWQAGELPSGLTWMIFESFLNILARRESVTLFDYIRQYSESVKNLLPTYDYLFDATSGLSIPISSITHRNMALEELNNNVVLLLDRVAAITGGGQRSALPSTVARLGVSPHTPEHGLLWEDGEVRIEEFTQLGDGTVTLDSAEFGADRVMSRVTERHNVLVNAFADEILETLGLARSTNIFTVPDTYLYYIFASPLTVAITDPYGRLLDTADGTNNIPDAGFIQEEWIKIISIPNPVPGDYAIALTGTGTGPYHGRTILINDESRASIEAEIAPGFITPGKVIPYLATIPENTTTPIEFSINDQTPPSLAFDPVPLNNYLHNASFTVGLTAEDDLTGIASNSLMLDENPILEDVPIDLFFLDLGDHQLIGRATDGAGNTSEIRHAFHVGASVASTISDLDRLYSMGWIKRYSTYLKLRVVLHFLEKIDQKNLPSETVQKLENIMIDKFIGILEKERAFMNADAYRVLYDNAMYLLS